MEATSLFIERGHKVIACVQGLARTSPNQERVRGYQAALAEHGIPMDDSLVAGSSFSEENGYICAKLLIKKARGITAMLALSNLIALGILRALSEESMRAPDDVSIICFDDQPYCAYLNPPMTTVEQNKEQMGRIAVRLLLDQIQAAQGPMQEGIVLPTRLIERGSVRRIGV